MADDQAHIVGIDHIQLAMPTGQEDTARRFYSGLLNIPEVPKPPELAKRGGVWFENGLVKVHLGVDPNFHPAHKAHPGLLVRDLKALVLKLREAGVAVSEAEALPGYDHVYAADPFGNRLELMERVIEVREERPADVAAIRDVNNRAFGQDLEGKIVDALRSNGAALLSLVATLNNRVVGHIMYSPISVGGKIGAALGPMAVLPQHQNRGVGSKLVEAGNRKIKDLGYSFIIVLGHSNFYPRFGFAPAGNHGIQCEWEVSDDAFMLLVLDAEKMRGVSGVAKYRDEFSSAM
jgi:putative acetyltransferase